MGKTAIGRLVSGLLVLQLLLSLIPVTPPAVDAQASTPGAAQQPASPPRQTPTVTPTAAKRADAPPGTATPTTQPQATVTRRLPGAPTAAPRGSTSSSPSIASANTMVLSAAGTVRIMVESVSNVCNGDFGIDQPITELLVANYNVTGLGQSLDRGPFAAGTELVFYISPYSFCGPNRFLSTDPAHARIEAVGTDDWRIYWEDWTDANFTDLIVRVKRLGANPDDQAAPPESPTFDPFKWPFGKTPDPVHTLTGNFTYTRTDVAIAGRGPTPVFTRTYNSADTRVGPLGPGWTHSYAIRLRYPGDASLDLLLVGPMGRSDRYTRNPDGSYTPPAGVDTTLVKNADNTYTATHKDQSTWRFDSVGNLIVITDRVGNQSTLSYTAANQITRINDPAGRGWLTFSYNATTGRLESITDWASPARVIRYGYDAAGRLQTVTDREGKVTTFAYDGASHRLTTITDANGHVAVTNHYDAQGRVDWQQDARGLVTGQQTTLTYADNGDGTKTTTTTLPATSLDPAWTPTVADTYDASGRLMRRLSKPTAVSTEWATVEYAYDAVSNVSAITDARGYVTSYCYDVDEAGATIAGGRRNLTRVIAPAPTTGANRPVILYTYDSKDNLIKTISPKGVASGPTVDCTTNLSTSLNQLYATDLAYDAATQTKLESVTRRSTDPDLGQQTAVTKYEYGDAANPGLVTKVIPPRGNTGASPDYTYATSLTYGSSGSTAGLLTSVTDPLGNKTTYAYDAVGRRTSMVDPLGNTAGGAPTAHTWSYEYDREDRLRLAKAPAPTVGGAQLVSEARYDAVGNRTVLIDANGQVTTYLYDERDSLSEVQQSPSAWTDPAVVPSPLLRTTYAYDHLGNLTRVTRAAGDASYERATDYAYDGLNRVRQETQYPAWPTTTPTLVTTTTYDLAGNRATLVDPLGQTTTFAYDALNRLTGIAYSDPATAGVSYAYDAHGNRTSMADGTGSTSYTYDEADRLLSVTSPSSPGPKTVGYRYDRDGNRTKTIYPDTTAVSSTFDKAGRLTSLIDWANRTTSYGYLPDGALQTITHLNGATSRHSYDNARRLTDVWNRQGATTIGWYPYALDKVGNRVDLGESGAPRAWGYYNSLTPTPVSGLYAITAATGGDSHSLALKSDGTVWAWGDNGSGQLGDGTSSSRTAPAQVRNLSGVTAIAAGGNASLALKSDGTVWAWGDRPDDGFIHPTPSQISGLSGVTAIATSGGHTLAVKSDGTVWAWGRNHYGQLGDGTTTDRSSPVQVSGLTGVVAIAAGGIHSLAVKSDGTVWTWGNNSNGQLGTSGGNRSTPGQMRRFTDVAAIAGGTWHSLARKSDGTVWAWGRNDSGQLGDGGSRDSTNPVQVSGLTGATSIAAGSDHNLVRKNDGTVWAWGRNQSGQLGDGTLENRATAVQVGGLGSMTTVGAGSNHSLATIAAESNAVGYDRLSRLTSVDAASGQTTYTYDPAGNRLSRTRGGSTTSYGYDRADRITSAGGVSYTVNANGNLTARGSDSFSYDQANRLVSATVGGATSTYAYDGDGQRVSSTVGGTTTRSVYDVNAGLPVLLDDGSRKYVFGLGLAYAVDTAGTVEVYHTDGLGSVRALTDAAGTVTQTYQTDEFGIPTASQGSSTQPFGYTGEQQDSTGLVYLRARMYDPAIGRFVQRDPFPGLMGSPLSLNLYTYVENNSVNSTDPSGLDSRIKDSGFPCLKLPTSPMEWVLYQEECRDREAQSRSQVESPICSQPLLVGPTGLCIRSGSAPASRGPSGRVSTKKYLEKHWDKATFGSIWESIEYHLAKHGRGMSPVEYTQRALQLFRDSSATRKPVTDLSGRLAILVESDTGKGLYTPSGRIIYWTPKT